MADHIRIQRWPGPMGPVVGPALIIAPINEIAEKLAISGFMKPWLVEKIKAHLLAGESFLNKGATPREDELAMRPNGEVLSMQVRSEYRLATSDEVLNYVDTAEYASSTGKKISARAQEKNFVLHYHEGAKLIGAYDALPRQARTILDCLAKTGRDEFTEASVQVVLEENIGLLNTKQEPLKIFGFYRRRLIDEGHLEEVE